MRQSVPYGRALLRTATLWFGAVLAMAGAPVPLIFDTDMGNDIDDALALAMLHALASRGECRLLGVTLTNPAPTAAPFVRLVNRFYGRPSIPVGASTAKRSQGADRKYLDATLKAAPAGWRDAPGAADPPALPLLRRLLAGSAERVVVVQVGFSENLAALLDSRPDDASPLDGAALVRQKVALLSVMAGDFTSDTPEYNVRINVKAARRVLEECRAKRSSAVLKSARSCCSPPLPSSGTSPMRPGTPSERRIAPTRGCLMTAGLGT